MTGSELRVELAGLADRLEAIRAELVEQTASGDLAPDLVEAVSAACRLASHAAWLSRELYEREVESRGVPWVDL